jgi:hypothetical protein
LAASGEDVSTAEPTDNPLFSATWDLLNSAQPGTLFHYSDQVGYLGILQSGKLWATGIQLLNDSLEYELGLRLIAQNLDNRRNLDPTIRARLDAALDVSVGPHRQSESSASRKTATISANGVRTAAGVADSRSGSTALN